MAGSTNRVVRRGTTIQSLSSSEGLSVTVSVTPPSCACLPNSDERGDWALAGNVECMSATPATINSNSRFVDMGPPLGRTLQLRPASLMPWSPH